LKNLLPDPVLESIQLYLRQQGRRLHDGWEAHHRKEDALTGAAFDALRTKRSRVVHTLGGEWRWRVRSREFGGGGKKSEEYLTGADSIIQIEVRHLGSGRVFRKGLVVQAKKDPSFSDRELLLQVGKMEDLVAGGSAVLGYSPDEYFAVDGRELVSVGHATSRSAPTTRQAFGEYLADRFLLCDVGARGLYYDADRGLLVLPREPKVPDAVRVWLRRRLQIEIESLST
jgi:hypothetical protein